MSVSVIILTFNEERNIGKAIDSVAGWAKEIFVVDSFSTDRTVEIALSRAAEGVRVVQHAFQNYSDQWNWALRALPLTGEWTFKLDADECVTPALRDEISAKLLNHPAPPQGALIRWQMFFLGAPINWGGYSRRAYVRLWRTGAAIFENRSVNEHALVEGEKLCLWAPLEHYDYKSLTNWLSKHNRYSSMEAACYFEGDRPDGVSPRLFGSSDERRTWLRKVYYRLPMRPVLYFIIHYVFRLGFLDGVMGFRLWFLRSVYMYWIDLKVMETKLTGLASEVDWPARGAPHPRVSASAIQRDCDARFAALDERQAA